MRLSAPFLVFAQVRIFANTLYYGSTILDKQPTGDNANDELSSDDRFHLIAPCLQQGVSLSRRARETGVSFRVICRRNSRIKCHTWLPNQGQEAKQAGTVTNNSEKSATNNFAKSVSINSETHILTVGFDANHQAATEPFLLQVEIFFGSIGKRNN